MRYEEYQNELNTYNQSIQKKDQVIDRLKNEIDQISQETNQLIEQSSILIGEKVKSQFFYGQLRNTRDMFCVAIGGTAVISGVFIASCAVPFLSSLVGFSLLTTVGLGMISLCILTEYLKEKKKSSQYRDPSAIAEEQQELDKMMKAKKEHKDSLKYQKGIVEEERTAIVQEKQQLVRTVTDTLLRKYQESNEDLVVKTNTTDAKKMIK